MAKQLTQAKVAEMSDEDLINLYQAQVAISLLPDIAADKLVSAILGGVIETIKEMILDRLASGKVAIDLVEKCREAGIIDIYRKFVIY